jgi:hypothetical protein
MVVVAALLALAAPAVAAPQWSEPEAISQPPVGGGPMSMDARGNTLVVFHERYGDGSQTWGGNRVASSYRWWTPGRGWGPLHDLPRSRGYIAGAKITPHGEAHLLIKGTGAERVPLALATAAPGGRVSDFQPIGEAYGSGGSHAFGIDDAGNATVAWSPADEPGRLNVSVRPAGGAVGAPERVEGAQPMGSLGVVVNPAGAAVVTWYDQAAWIAYRAPGGTFGPKENARVGQMSLNHVALDLDGEVFVAGAEIGPMQWPGQPGSKPPRAALAVRSPLGDWAEPQIVDEAGQTTGLTVDARGVATLSITQSNAWNPDGKSFVVVRHPDGRLEREQLADDTAPSPSGAINHRGDVLVAWGSHWSAEQPAVYVRERLFGASAFGAPVLLARSQPSAGLGVVMNDARQAMVLWHEVVPDGQGFRAGPVRVVTRDDPSLRPPAPPEVDLYRDPLAALDPDGDLTASVRCAVSCKVRASGLVFPDGQRAALRGSGRSVRLKAKRRSKVKLDFGEQGAELVREALAAGKRPWVSLTVTARGKSPRPVSVSRRYKLAR